MQIKLHTPFGHTWIRKPHRSSPKKKPNTITFCMADIYISADVLHQASMLGLIGEGPGQTIQPM
jgi:hypothetical protein